MSNTTSKKTIVKNMVMVKNGTAAKGSAAKGSAAKGIKKSWTNPKYPCVEGWTRVEHTRGPNDKQAGVRYYTYYPPRGNRKQIRSIVRVNARMAADAPVKVVDVDDDEVVIVTPKKCLPEVVDLTKDDEDEVVPSTTNITVYGNVTMCVTPGGGYHIKWNE
tara:strand:- start:591 stop:1073 length:483 start_codon:yes stop_codon:yes gene_type:complete